MSSFVPHQSKPTSTTIKKNASDRCSRSSMTMISSASKKCSKLAPSDPKELSRKPSKKVIPHRLRVLLLESQRTTIFSTWTCGRLRANGPLSLPYSHLALRELQHRHPFRQRIWQRLHLLQNKGQRIDHPPIRNPFTGFIQTTRKIARTRTLRKD